jgi:hypothetical protein
MDLQRRAIIDLRESKRDQNDDRDAQAQTKMTMFRSCNLRLRRLHEPRHNLPLSFSTMRRAFLPRP